MYKSEDLRWESFDTGSNPVLRSHIGKVLILRRFGFGCSVGPCLPDGRTFGWRFGLCQDFLDSYGMMSLWGFVARSGLDRLSKIPG